MPVDTPALIVALVVTLGAATLQGTIGFGLAMVAVPVLSLVDPALAPVPQLIISLPITMSMAWRERHAADLRQLGWVLTGRVPGAAIGLWLLASFTRETLSAVIGGMVLGAVVIVALRTSVPRNRATSFAAGVTSGATGLVASIGGPPLALLYRSAEGPTIRASLGVVFAIGIATSIIIRAAASQLEVRDLEVAALLLPAAVGGLWLGRRFQGRVEGAILRAVILVVSGGSAVALLVRSVL
jgi:uncharacterized membrane protein YfcA